MDVSNFDEVTEILFTYVREDLLYFAIVFSAVLGKIKESSKKNIYAVWIVYFIGTFFHELAHFIISFLTFGKPTWFSVFPSRSEDSKTGEKSIILGYVKSSNMRWWNTFYISMAPLLLLPLSYFVYQDFFYYVELNLWTLSAYIFIIITLLFSSIPSGVDFGNVFNRDAPVNLLSPIMIILGVYFIVHENLFNIGNLL